jgi:hypothetical protein
MQIQQSTAFPKFLLLIAWAFTLSMLLCACSSPSHQAFEQHLKQDTTIGQAGSKLKTVFSTSYRHKKGDTCFGGITRYNTRGQKMEELDYSACAQLFKKETFRYDSEGKIISSQITSRFENVNYQWLYDQEGRLIAKQADKPTAVFQYLHSFSYNQKNELITYKGTQPNGEAVNGTSRKEFIYENGKKTETLCYGGPKFDQAGYRIKHFYDQNNREIMNIIYKDNEGPKVDTAFFYYEYY